MPKMTAQPTQLLRLPQIEMLSRLKDGQKLTTSKLQNRTGLSVDPSSLLDLGLVEKEILRVDGLQETVWKITGRGKEALKTSNMANTPPKAPELATEPINLKVTTLVPWAGGARLTAEAIGRELEGIPFVGIPFAGGMSELVHIKASTILVNDLHRHVINLAAVLANPSYGPKLIRELRRLPFHPDTLNNYQRLAQDIPNGKVNYAAAKSYFVSQWMGRNGKSGGDAELKGALALRFSATGGDSALRYSQAVKGLREWRKILQRCTFSCMDWREFLKKVKDGKAQSIYADPPWPELGDAFYTHKFKLEDHKDLATTLDSYKEARIVLRYLDCPLSRRLYPESKWTWRRFAGRNTGNKEVKEVLIIKNPKA